MFSWYPQPPYSFLLCFRASSFKWCFRFLLKSAWNPCALFLSRGFRAFSGLVNVFGDLEAVLCPLPGVCGLRFLIRNRVLVLGVILLKCPQLPSIWLITFKVYIKFLIPLLASYCHYSLTSLVFTAYNHQKHVSSLYACF